MKQYNSFFLFTSLLILCISFKAVGKENHIRSPLYTSSKQFKDNNFIFFNLVQDHSFANYAPILLPFGPLIIDANNIIQKKDVYIVPSLNDQGQPFFLAINCTTRKLNVKDIGSWNGWLPFKYQYEKDIFQQICN